MTYHLAVNSSHMDTDDDSSSAASDRGRLAPPPGSAPVPILQSQPPPSGYPPPHQGYDVDAASDDQEGATTDEEERHDVVQAVLPSQSQASSVGGRPASAMSSQMRYRTPMAQSLAFSPTPTMQTSVLPPPPPPQPIHRYTTPSAFAQPAPLPQGPPSTASYPPSMSYVQQPIPTGSSGLQFDAYSGRGSVVQHTPTQRIPLERAIEATQTSLAALNERLDALESGIHTATPPHATLQVSGQRSRVGSPQQGFPSSFFPGGPHSFDPHQMGAWSMILVPLSRVIGPFQRLMLFLAFPPDPNRTSTRRIIIRRLVLDASFALTVLTVLRSLWRATGMRRREVLIALLGVWHAIAGTPRRTRVLVDKAV